MMRQRVSVSLVGLTLVAFAFPLQGQETAPDSAAIAGAVQTLESDLRSYVTRQEAFYADHLKYAATTSAMRFEPSPGVTVVVLTSSERGHGGHSAVAIHSAVPGLVCGVWVGSEEAPPLRNGADEGDPTCRIPEPAPQ
jgi:hypothetical protein